MSSYLCEECGAQIIDAGSEYITGCRHWPLNISDAFLYRCTNCGIHFIDINIALIIKEHVIERCRYCR